MLRDSWEKDVTRRGQQALTPEREAEKLIPAITFGHGEAVTVLSEGLTLKARGLRGNTPAAMLVKRGSSILARYLLNQRLLLLEDERTRGSLSEFLVANGYDLRPRLARNPERLLRAKGSYVGAWGDCLLMTVLADDATGVQEFAIASFDLPTRGLTCASAPWYNLAADLVREHGYEVEGSSTCNIEHLETTPYLWSRSVALPKAVREMREGAAQYHREHTAYRKLLPEVAARVPGSIVEALRETYETGYPKTHTPDGRDSSFLPWADGRTGVCDAATADLYVTLCSPQALPDDASIIWRAATAISPEHAAHLAAWIARDHSPSWWGSLGWSDLPALHNESGREKAFLDELSDTEAARSSQPALIEVFSPGSQWGDGGPGGVVRSAVLSLA